MIAGSIGTDERRELALWAADCAARVLPLFEEACPEDRRPRDAIEAARAWAQGDIRVGPARDAAARAHDAARDLDGEHPAARAAARAAGHAAATAHLPGHARHAAAYAVLAAAETPEGRDGAAGREHAWQMRRLPAHLRPAVSREALRRARL